MAKFTDALRATLQGYFDAGDQPTEAQFDALILAIQAGIEEHQHDGTGDGDGTKVLGGPITLVNAALTSAATFYGINLNYAKVAGAGGAGDDYYGIRSELTINQATIVDNVYAGFMLASLTQGTADRVFGLQLEAQVDGGLVNDTVSGILTQADVNAGVVTGEIRGMAIRVDIEAAATCNDNIFGIYVWLDDLDNTSPSYMLYMDEANNVNYGIYQNGTAPNRLGGSLILNELAGGGNRPISVDNDGKIIITP